MGVKTKKPQVIYANHNYTIIVTNSPSNANYTCYGLRNNKTDVIEGFVSILAVAIKMADEYDKDLRFGLDREEDDEAALARPLFNRPQSQGGPSSSLQ